MTCANNCRGVDPNSLIVGGGAVLAAASISALSYVPSVGLGVMFLGGGVMLARQMCLAPIYCRSRTGQCCLLRGSLGGPRCPRSC
jgi:hypothetical protein